MHIFMYFVFIYQIHNEIGFFVFLVFRLLKIKDSLEQVRLVGFSSESLQAAFFVP